MKKTGFGLEHGDVPAGLFVEDAKVDVGHGGKDSERNLSSVLP